LLKAARLAFGSSAPDGLKKFDVPAGEAISTLKRAAQQGDRADFF